MNSSNLCRSAALRRALRSVVSPLGLIAGLSLIACPASAQTSSPPDRSGETLEQIDVTAPKRKPPKRRAVSGAQPTPVAAPAVEPAPVPPRGPISTSDVGLGANTTPLNTNVVTESASRLGLTPRETPATVEVLDQQTLRDRGYHHDRCGEGHGGCHGGRRPRLYSQLLDARILRRARSTRSTTGSGPARRPSPAASWTLEISSRSSS